IPVLATPSKSPALVYGPGAGYTALRESIAEWLTSVYEPAEAIPSSRLCVTNGPSANLAAILAKFSEPGYTRNIWMIEPSYFLACPIFTDAGFAGQLRGVPQDDEGLNIEFLRSGLAASEKEAQQHAPRLKIGARYPKIYRHIIYLVPTFSNPSGKTMSLRRREELVRLAREFDALVVTDDVYDVLRWPEDKQHDVILMGKAPPRIVDVDRKLDGGCKDEWGNAVSNGSFSKIIAPGMRVGWAESTASFTMALSRIGSTGSGGCPTHLAATFVDEMLQSGKLQEFIKSTLVPTYRSRSYAMKDAIKSHLLPLGFEMSVAAPHGSVSTPKVNGYSSKCKTNGINGVNGVNGVNCHAHDVAVSGGYFIYIMIPKNLPITAQELAAKALEDINLKFAFGDMFQVEDDAGSAQRAANGFGRGIRLCWAWHTEEEIGERIQRLTEFVRGVIM
ncbi:pyridoxal phosphate-dependent transferase, partial [Lipomyces kononenkoae]